jgi:aspartyl-tRNA(Asn)/glutamyl-tRNA(Gln) amidotransferase subunit A
MNKQDNNPTSHPELDSGSPKKNSTTETRPKAIKHGPVWPSLKQLVEDVNSGVIKPSDLVEKSLSLIEQAESYNSVLLSLPERAKKMATEIELKLKAGEEVGPLAGIPFLVKDNYLIKDTKMTASSNILNDFISPYTATAVTKLEDAGAICVGKTNLDAFAHGGSTENSDFGVTLNPHDTKRVPGGSSGGSAAAVALSLVPFALGSDTGGSIRLPASFCGAVGLKPSYGAVSRYGVVSMASSTDCMGPITNSVEDARLILSLMSGIDELDSTTVELERHPELDSGSPNKSAELKIGIIKQFYGEGLQPEVKQKTLTAINKFKELGYQVEEVDLPALALSLAAYYVIIPAEISSNLMRYDGIRYGLSLSDGQDLADIYSDSRSAGFNSENKRRIMIGAYVLSSGYYDAYYKRAQTVRTKIINQFKAAFEEFDLLAGPVAPTTAFKIGENAADPLAMYLADVMTVGVSLAGLPALSLPVGVDNQNLPIGLQLICKAKDDYKLLNLSAELEEILG